MDIEKMKSELTVTISEVIAEAEQLIELSRAALVALNDVVDEESAARFDEEIASKIENGFKHIQLF